MILNINKLEISVLLLHMTITRKSIRNGFKRNYRNKEYKEFLSSFDEVKESLETVVSDIDDENDDLTQVVELNYNIREFKMIDAFLNWYVNRLESTLKDASELTNKNILKEDLEQLNALKSIENKMTRLKEVYNIA